ncbi:hypothetical protein SKAU_G00045500 [Synaphobranchus kaupii]|uniref:Uncharacterized protein n=1 Tax=Synaphobranchus kaupii TaxID=118154 RepID=A0A9Q1G3A3_SYNKA|nr:hypothetical protein SKAU_G00045500 [Synaphobranchus kaupii]
MRGARLCEDPTSQRRHRHRRPRQGLGGSEGEVRRSEAKASQDEGKVRDYCEKRPSRAEEIPPSESRAS